MRRLVYFMAIITLFACTGREKKSQISETTPVVTVDKLLSEGTSFVDKEVTLSGMVNHVCKHSGERCFVMGRTDDEIIRIEAGKIGSFDQALIGSDIEVKGIVRMVKVDDGEADPGHDHPEKRDPEAGEEACATEEKAMKNATSERGYRIVYFLDGISMKEKEL